MGLVWGDAGGDSIKRAARGLLALQKNDGGWSQLQTLESDAYATGQALYALNLAARMTTGDAAIRRGVDYLLGTQAADGSWHVKSRAIWLQPYFESGFPYGQDQFISTAGTATVLAIAAGLHWSANRQDANAPACSNNTPAATRPAVAATSSHDGARQDVRRMIPTAPRVG